MKKKMIQILAITFIAILFMPGCDKDSNNEVNKPIANFNVSENQIRIWETVKFSDTSINQPIEWEWFFEGGEPEVSTDLEPEVLYKEAGSYSVKLVARNDNGESVKEMENFIEVSEYQNYFGLFQDSRDGQEYKTIGIGNTIIMAENLRYVTDGAVFYDNNPMNGSVYGLLYKWETALEACPTGWRLPTRNEYDMIRGYLGGEYVAGGKLKKSGTEFWLSPNQFGSNETGFSAVGAGGYYPGHLDFYGIKENTTFWTQTEATEDLVWSVVLSYTTNTMYIQNTTRKETGYFSVRCIKD